MKKIGFVWMMIAVLLMGTVSVAAQDTEMAQIPQAAQQAAEQIFYDEILAKVQYAPQKWNIPENLSKEAFSLGDGVVEYFPTQNFVLSEEVTDLGVRYLFPVLANGQPTMLMEIIEKNGEYQIFKYGGDAAAYVTAYRILQKAGYRPFAVEYSGTDFYVVEQRETLSFVPVVYNETAKQTNQLQTLSLTEFQTQAKRISEESVSGERGSGWDFSKVKMQPFATDKTPWIMVGITGGAVVITAIVLGIAMKKKKTSSYKSR